MAFVKVSAGRITIGDREWSGDLAGYSANTSVDVYDVTCIADTAKTFIPGQEYGDVGVNGFINQANAGTANSQWQDLKALRGSSAGVPAMIGFDGFTADDDVLICAVYETSWADSSAQGGPVTFNLSLSTTGTLDYGKSLFDPTSAQTASVNGTAVDNASSTANGGIGVLSVVAASGTSPTLDAVVQHSADNITYTALGTFTQATGTTSEKVTVAAGTTVNRYLRVAATIGGTAPSFKFAVGFARL